MDVSRTEFLRARRKRRLVSGTIGGLMLAGVAYAIVRLEPISVSVERSELLIDTVRRGEFVRQVRGPGVLAPRDSRWPAAQAAGRVERILLKPGSTVQPDSVIAVLASPELAGGLPAGARPDLSVDGTIEIERRRDTLFVDRPATGEPESKVSVFRVDADGAHAHRTAVQLGKASVNEIQVVSGLHAGDRIIVSDVSQWSASDELRIR